MDTHAARVDRPPPKARPAGAGDRAFAGLARGAGIVLVLALAGVSTFLVLESVPALSADGSQLGGKSNFLSFVAPYAFGTVFAAAIHHDAVLRVSVNCGIAPVSGAGSPVVSDVSGATDAGSGSSSSSAGGIHHGRSSVSAASSPASSSAGTTSPRTSWGGRTTST